MPSPAEWLAGRLLEPVHFGRERKQLLGIKERSERTRLPVPETASGRPQVTAA